MVRGNQSVLFRLGASLLVLIFFLAGLEVVIRVSGLDTSYRNRFFVLNRALDYPEVFRKDRELFWRFRADQVITSKFFEGKTYRINSIGLRGEEIPPEKHGLRILALGNSCTFGWGVSYAETFPERLERMLDAGGEVINGGIPGYSSFQGRRLFERELVGLEPDIVLIMFGWNDHWAAANEVADKDQELPPHAIITLQNLLSDFHTYRLLKKLLLSAIEDDPDSLFDRKAPVYRVGLQDFRNNLKAMCDLSRQRGAMPVLLTSPIPALRTYYPAYARSPMHVYHEMYNAAVRELASSGDIDMVDLAGEFDRHSDLYDDAPRDPMHFNARGHQVAAQLIAEYLRKHRLPGEQGN